MTSQISLFISITAIIFATSAVIIMGIYREHNASNQLTNLGNIVVQVETQTQIITNNIGTTNGNLPVLIQKNVTFNHCIVNGNLWCSNLTTNFINAQNNLTNVYTVESLNISLIETTTSCNNQINTLKTMIVMFNTGTANLPTLLQSGNTQVSIGGNMVVALYEIYNLKMSKNELNIYYLVIQPWSLNITGIFVNPTIKYQGFSPSISSCTNTGISLGKHKVVGAQSSLFSPVSLVVYGYEMFCNGNIDFSTQGVLNTGNTVQLTGKLMIIIN